MYTLFQMRGFGSKGREMVWEYDAMETNGEELRYVHCEVFSGSLVCAR